MPFIILDRDGVINYDSLEYIKSPDEWHAIPGSLEAIAHLNRHDFRVFIATNQSGVARKHYDLETLDLIHEKLVRELAAVGGYIEEIFFCPHHPDEQCVCRKPAPGMLLAIAEKYQLDLSQIFFVGDTYTDYQAALAAGCKFILVLTSKGQAALEANPILRSLPHFSDLSQAVTYILEEQEKDKHVS